MSPRYLVDTSAWALVADRDVGDHLEDLAHRGLIATAGIIELEVLYTARGPSDYVRISAERRAAFPLREMGAAEVDAALTTQRALAERGHHRAASLPDLLIAATAAHAGLTVLHYDRDFEIIAAVTGQPVERVAPAGSFPEPQGRPYVVLEQTSRSRYLLLDTVVAVSSVEAATTVHARRAGRADTGQATYGVVPKRRWRMVTVGEVR